MYNLPPNFKVERESMQIERKILFKILAEVLDILDIVIDVFNKLFNLSLITAIVTYLSLIYDSTILVVMSCIGYITLFFLTFCCCLRTCLKDELETEQEIISDKVFSRCIACLSLSVIFLIGNYIASVSLYKLSQDTNNSNVVCTECVKSSIKND